MAAAAGSCRACCGATAGAPTRVVIYEARETIWDVRQVTRAWALASAGGTSNGHPDGQHLVV